MCNFVSASDIKQHTQTFNGNIHIIEHTTSTNDLVNDNIPFDVWIANTQTKARGTHGKTYYTPKNKGIWLSFSWHSAAPIPVSILIGIASAKTLQSVCKEHAILLKWPNDIVYKKQKIGGILVESTMRDGRMQYVIGIGINTQIDMQHPIPHAIDLQAITGKIVEHNMLIAKLLDSYYHILHSAVDIVKTWAQYSATHKMPITIQDMNGIHTGIDHHGALILETPEGIQRINAGSIMHFYRASTQRPNAEQVK